MGIQLGGISSGLDTQSIIEDLMKVEKSKITKVEKDKQLIEWKQEIYNDVGEDLAQFILDVRKELGINEVNSYGSINDSQLDELGWVKKASSDNESFASVSSTAEAVNGSFDVTIKRLADNYSTASKSNISVGDKTNLKDQFGLAITDTINFKIETSTGSKDFDYVDLANTSMEDIVSDINNSNLGVTAVYDEDIDRFFLQTDETGESNFVKISNTTATKTSTVDFLVGAADILNINLTEGTSYKGVNSLIDFNGAVDIQKESNNFSINGINLELKKADPAETFTVRVDTNVDSVYDKIKTFVDKYNDVISKTNELLNQERFRTYTPLSKEEKDSMNEKDIELWEEKAKSGLIRGDLNISTTLSSVRNGMYQDVTGATGKYDNMIEIGITTESYFGGGTNGQLKIDETLLKEKIAEDVDSVLELLLKQTDDNNLKTNFEKNLTTDEIKQKRSESGLLVRLFDNLVVGIGGIIGKAGAGESSQIYRDVNSSIMLDFTQNYKNISLLDSELTRYDKRIDGMNTYLASVENRYWKKFTAMEKALEEMNSKSAWISSQFA